MRQFLPAVGGMEIYVKDMIHEQQTMGYTCEVLTLNKIFLTDGKILPSKDTIEGITIHRIGFKGKRSYFLPVIKPSFFKNYDIVHVHNTDMLFDTVGLICRFYNIPCFATTHGGYFHTQNFARIKKLYFKTITKFSCSHYKVLFASSKNDYELFIETNNNLILTPNAITPLGNFLVDGQDFIYIGRLAHHKKVDQLIKTFVILVKKYNIQGNLHIIGPEWDVTRNFLQSTIDELGITGRVIIHGYIDQERMGTVLKKCGYFVSASVFEGFGMSMLEGMSVGLIPYVYPNGSFKELIKQGKIGLCVDYSHPENAAREIANHIITITYKDRIMARDFSNEFSWKELAEKTINIYETQ